MRMSAYVTPSLRAVFSAMSASAFLSIPFAAAPAVFRKSRREVVIDEPRAVLELKDGEDLTRRGGKSQRFTRWLALLVNFVHIITCPAGKKRVINALRSN